MRFPQSLAALHLGSFLFALAFTAPSAPAQSDDAYVPAMTFATVTLHDSEATEACDLAHAFVLGTSAFGVSNCDLTSLIAQAYGLRRDQLVGLPNQITSYDILAKADDASETRIARLDPKQQELEQHHMLQALLANRFKLKVHSESRTAKAYDLVEVKRGMMMDPAGTDPPADEEQKDWADKPTPPLYRGGDSTAGFFYIARSAAMSDIASMLSEQFDRPVFDKTGLTGRYDFDLHYRGLTAHDRDAASADPVPPLDQAIQWQLGLRLKPSRGLELFLVIDHVEKPTLN